MAEDKELATNLKLAKTKPMFFVFVAKGTDGKLIVEKKKIPAKVGAEAKKELGGGIIFRGRVQTEAGTLVFETKKEVPETVANLTKKIIKREAGLTLDVAYRIAADLEDDDEEPSETSQTGMEGGAKPPEAPPQPPSKEPALGEASARFAARLKALAPVLEKAEAINKAAVTQAKAQIADGNKAFLAKKFDDANAALDRAENLIKQGLASVASKGTTPPSAPPPPSGGAADAEKRAQARLKALEPVLKKIETIKSPEVKEVQQAIKEANKFLAKKDFDSANGTLDIAESMIKGILSAGVGSAPPPPPPPSPQASLEEIEEEEVEVDEESAAAVDQAAFKKKWADAKAAWQEASDTVDGQISKLQAKLKASGDKELQEIAEYGLNGVTGNHKVPLMAVMRELDGASGDKLKVLVAKAAVIAAGFKQHIDSAETVAACDNAKADFGVDVTIKQTMGGALGELTSFFQSVQKA